VPAVDLAQRKIEKESGTKPSHIDSDTAFVVAVMKDGSVAIVPNINAPVTKNRDPEQADFKNAISALNDDMNAQRLAAMVAQHIMNMQMQMAQQAQAQQIASRLDLGK
jgi:hypothetical protein